VRHEHVVDELGPAHDEEVIGTKPERDDVSGLGAASEEPQPVPLELVKGALRAMTRADLGWRRRI